MKPDRFSLIALLALTLISPVTLAQDSQPASSPAKKDLPQAKMLLEKAVEAMGGKDAFKQIKTSRTKMSIETPMGNVAIDSSVGENGRFHADIDQAGMVMTSGSNGEYAWMQNPMAGGYQLLPQEQADQMRQQTSVHDIVLQMMKQFDIAKTVDVTDFNDESCYQVHMSSEKTKEEQEAFFSVKTGRIVGTTSTQEGPMGEMEISMSFKEWKKFGDLTLFTEIGINQMGMEMVMKIDEIEFNKVDPAIFTMPDEVKELIAEAEAAASSQPESLPEYSIINSNVVPNIKRSLDIRLKKKVTEDALRSLAFKLKSQDSRTYERTFISYYLPDMKVGAGAWATTHFNPELKVLILGLSAEQEKKLKQQSSDPSRKVVGTWIDDRPYIGNRITIFRQSGKIFMEELYQDGSGGKSELVETKSRHGRRFDKVGTVGEGDYWILDSNGNLQIRDNEGIILTAKKMK